MSASSLRHALQPHRSAVVDSSVTVAYLDGTDAHSGLAAILFDELVDRESVAALSAVTVTESLVRPMKLGDLAAIADVERFFAYFPGVRVLAVDHDVAREAARVRALTNLKTPDALIIATALVHDIEAVVTADGRWRSAIGKVTGLTLLDLADHLPL